MPKSKFSAAISLLLVFVSGALVGVLGHRAYTMRLAASAPAIHRPSLLEWRKHFVADMRDRVKLDDAQATQLSGILEQVDREFRQLREKENQAFQKNLVDRISSILTPDQRVLYQQLRDQREAERRRWRQKMQSEKK
jgi:Spy/CpxP family protein refolding chaperone